MLDKLLFGRQEERKRKYWRSLTEKIQVLESLFILAALRNIAPLYSEWRLLKFGLFGMWSVLAELLSATQEVEALAHLEKNNKKILVPRHQCANQGNEIVTCVPTN